MTLETAVGRAKTSVHCFGQELDLPGETKNAAVTSLVIRRFFVNSNKYMARPIDLSWGNGWCQIGAANCRF